MSEGAARDARPSAPKKTRAAGPKIAPERALQLGFMLLLAVCAAQVCWWIFDEVVHTQRVHEEILAHHARDAAAARHLIESGLTVEEALVLFDDLVPADGPELVTVDPVILADLTERRRARLNRFGWEGSFFLLVIVAGSLVLARAIRQDTILRRRQQNFVAAVSHEFKSPVASLRLTAETLLYRDPPVEQRKRLATRLVEDIDRLETMVSNILDTARIEEGALRLQPERISLARAVAQAAAEIDARAKEAQVHVDTAVPEEAEIVADPVALRSILRNLFDNALKATAARDGGRVTVSASADARHVTLVVADDGVGFPPEDAERLFEKFYRPGDEMTRQSRGSGLGLYLVRRFLELDGGRIEGASAGAGQGARFTLQWPRPEEQA